MMKIVGWFGLFLVSFMAGHFIANPWLFPEGRILLFVKLYLAVLLALILLTQTIPFILGHMPKLADVFRRTTEMESPGGMQLSFVSVGVAAPQESKEQAVAKPKEPLRRLERSPDDSPALTVVNATATAKLSWTAPEPIALADEKIKTAPRSLHLVSPVEIPASVELLAEDVLAIEPIIEEEKHSECIISVEIDEDAGLVENEDRRPALEAETVPAAETLFDETTSVTDSVMPEVFSDNEEINAKPIMEPNALLKAESAFAPDDLPEETPIASSYIVVEEVVPSIDVIRVVNHLQLYAETLSFLLMADASGIEVESVEYVENEADCTIAHMAEFAAEDSTAFALEGLDIPTFIRAIDPKTLDDGCCENIDLMVETDEKGDVGVESIDVMDAVIEDETENDTNAVEEYAAKDFSAPASIVEGYEVVEGETDDASMGDNGATEILAEIDEKAFHADRTTDNDAVCEIAAAIDMLNEEEIVNDTDSLENLSWEALGSQEYFVETHAEVEQKVLSEIHLSVPPMEIVFNETDEPATEVVALCESQGLQENLAADTLITIIDDVAENQLDELPAPQRYTCRFRCRKPGGLLRGPVLSFYCKFICQSGNY